ncbi:hypothetical protein MMC30_003129 [Trapelia coarctata]|nr:hypothetical protein [Trapelia coarctata]
MQFSTITLLLGLLGAAAAGPNPTGKCNADNCLRAVRATAFPTRQGFLDCLVYQQTTITPAITTETVTLTNTVAPPAITFAKVKRDAEPLMGRAVGADGATTNSPTAIPTYASACSGAKRYSSACSCYGLPGFTNYAPTPTQTETVYVTETAAAPPVAS